MFLFKIENCWLLSGNINDAMNEEVYFIYKLLLNDSEEDKSFD